MTIAHTIATHPILSVLVALGAFGGAIIRIQRAMHWVRLAFPADTPAQTVPYAGWRGRSHH